MISGASDEELDIAIARADVLLELQPKIDELKKENQELKKQLEEKENQQKEFIEYIKKNIKHYKEIIRLDRENNAEQDCRRFETRWATYEEILSKYKEIIGGKE